MSHYDYEASKRIAAQDYPFYALIMAAMRQADTSNSRKLREAFPSTWEELDTRYSTPGGYIWSDVLTEQIEPEGKLYQLKADDPHIGLAAGDVLRCVPYRYDPDKLTVLHRVSDGYDPECNMYRTQVERIPDDS